MASGASVDGKEKLLTLITSPAAGAAAAGAGGAAAAGAGGAAAAVPIYLPLRMVYMILL